MDFQEFLIEQEKVYSRFRDTSKLVTEGTRPNIPDSQGGYLIVFRHPRDIAERIGEFSKRISQTVPAIVYDSETVHTSISDYGLREGFVPEKEVLSSLCDSVKETVTLGRPKINYFSWLYNQNTVIVAGTPDKRFFQMAKGVYSAAEKRGLKLRLPWGSHITANRFTGQRSPKELEDFFRLMDEAPVIGESVSELIDVAYFNFSPQGFKVTVHERFSL